MKKTMTEKEQESDVIIKLKGWQIPYLLGACRLGIWAEDWCADLIQTGCGTCDTHSAKWIFKVSHIIDNIKQQSDFDIEETEYGYPDAIKAINTLVEEQCVLNQKTLAEWEEEQMKQQEHQRDQLSQRTKKGLEASRKRRNENK